MSPPSDNGAAQPRIVLVDDDASFLAALTVNLVDAGYHVTQFVDPSAALAWFKGGGAAEAAVLDWNMAPINGIELLRQLRNGGIAVPVMMLTSLREPVYEELALERGAVEFVEKTKSPSIILKRLALMLSRPAPSAPKVETEPTSSLEVGELELKVEIKRALWSGQEIRLSLGEFQIVWLLVGRRGADVSYREIYDQMRGDGFLAGQGDEGYRANVRAAIKRIRAKFLAVDPGFDALENYAGFGYRWRDRG